MPELIMTLILAGLCFVTGLSAGIQIGEDRLKPDCTAYQAIDGKPVCIEFKTNNL